MSGEGKGSWVMEINGKVIIRVKGELLYNGPADQVPEELKEVMKQFTVTMEEALPILLGKGTS